MALYNGTYECGHEGKINITGKHKDRQYKIDRHFESHVCKECYQKEVERKIEDAKAKSETLPALTGTDKQIAWAMTLRVELIKKIEKASELNNADAVKALEYMILHITDAKFYIDHRNVAVSQVILDIVDMMPTKNDHDSDDNNACDNNKSQVMKEAWKLAKSSKVLPSLVGSEKQIKWANDLRQKFITKIADMERRMRANEFAEDADEIKQALEYMIEYKTDAKFYIDNRNANFSNIINDLFREADDVADAQ